MSIAHFRICIFLALTVSSALAQSPRRARHHFAIGDLVEDRSHGNQIVEVAGGVDGTGGYSLLIPAAGAVPVRLQFLRLMARADVPTTCPYGVGSIVEFSLMKVGDRGVATRAIGGYCQVKTSSSVSFEEVARLKPVKAVAKEPPPKAGQYGAGQKLQVRSGDYWIPAIIESFDEAAAWYTVRFPNAAQMMMPAMGYASAAVLR